MTANPNPSEPEQPSPDPGNSPPEDWTEDLSAEELEDVKRLLDEET